jgi:ABC-type nitrate/sulfonate/bicarbonate transport system substrate-binding protein
MGATLASALGVLSIGSHGVVWFGLCFVPYTLIAPMFLAALAGYYLVWKYIVGFLNRVLGIA